MKVKRYDLDEGEGPYVPAEMVESESGYYVMYEDYAKAEEKKTQLQVAVDALMYNTTLLSERINRQQADISMLKGKLTVYMSNDVLVAENKRLRAAINKLIIRLRKEVKLYRGINLTSAYKTIEREINEALEALREK